jgi:hypothetical protein
MTYIHTIHVLTAHPLHNIPPAPAGAVRSCRGTASPLPGRTRSLRSASVIPTSPPPRGAPRVRSGSLQLHSAQTEGGETIGYRTGGTRNRPRPPENHGPGSRFPQTPSCLPPRRWFPPYSWPWKLQTSRCPACGLDRFAKRHEIAGITHVRRCGPPKRLGFGSCLTPCRFPRRHLSTGRAST